MAHPLVTYIQSTFRPLQNVWMADDGTFVAPIDNALKIYEYIKTKGPSRGLYMQASKDQSLVAHNVSQPLEKF